MMELITAFRKHGVQLGGVVLAPWSFVTMDKPIIEQIRPSSRMRSVMGRWRNITRAVGVIEAAQRRGVRGEWQNRGDFVLQLQ